MIVRAVLAVIIIGLLFYLLKNFRSQSKTQQKQLAIKYGFILVAGVLLLLIAAGKVHWITGAVAGGLAIISRSLPLLFKALPFLSQLKRQHSAGKMSSGNVSSVQTRFLSLQLNHDTGEITGKIIDGEHTGSSLTDLTKEQAQALLLFYQTNDHESYQLLLAYLQRTYGEESFGGNESTESSGVTTGNINRKEALDILGLDDTAAKKEIVAAHKKLMQKMHPDRGGSTYLAAKINEAKDYLLKQD